MKKLELSQMENLQGGNAFDDCMNSGLSKWQIQLAIATGALTGFGGLLGGFVGVAAYCAMTT